MKKKYVDFLKDIYSINESEECENDYKEDDVLANVGYDPEQIGVGFQLLADKLISSSPHNWRNNSESLEKSKKKYIDNKSGNNKYLPRESIIAEIQKILSDSKMEVKLAYRNLSTQTDDDLYLLLEQLKFLKSNEDE